MFIKDTGAHFTYNIGVSIMRASLLFFVIAIIVTAAYFIVDSVKLEYLGEVQAAVTELSQKNYVENPKSVYLMEVDEYEEKYGELPKTNYGLQKHGLVTFYYVTFVGDKPNGTPFAIQQPTTWTLYNDTYLFRLKQPRSTYKLYRETGSDKLFVSQTSKSKKAATREYCYAYGRSFSSVPLWGIFLPLVISAVLFFMGKKQINLAMKYPRSDVPEETAFPPTISPDSTDHGEHNVIMSENNTAKAQSTLPDKGAAQI